MIKLLYLAGIFQWPCMNEVHEMRSHAGEPIKFDAIKLLSENDAIIKSDFIIICDGMCNMHAKHNKHFLENIWNRMCLVMILTLYALHPTDFMSANIIRSASDLHGVALHFAWTYFFP